MNRTLLLLLAAGCLPVPTDLLGKLCDAPGECGPGLYCVEGRCAATPPAPLHPPPVPLPSPSCDGGAEDCTNGRDDDCDGHIDCADSDCDRMKCDGALAAAVCCGGSCKDLATDPQNCGICGASCAASEACHPVASGGGIATGRCTCSVDLACPHPGMAGLIDDQTCSSGVCECDEDGECGPGQKCNRAMGVCHY